MARAEGGAVNVNVAPDPGVTTRGLVVEADSPSCRKKVSLSAPGPKFRLDVPCFGTWRLTCSNPGLFCANSYVTVSSRPASASVAVFRAETVTGQLRTRDVAAARVPLAFHGRMRSRGGSEFVVESTAEGGTFTVRLPVVEMDLRISSPGYAPIYLWSSTDPAKILRLIQLSPGASVSGTVSPPIELRDKGPISVSLVAFKEAGNEGRMSLADPATPTDPRGFFQFSGVPPGEYDLEVRIGTLEPMNTGRVLVKAETETYLGEVVPEPPTTAVLEVSPPLDGAGKVWRVDLTPTSARHRSRKGVVDSAGRIEFADFSRGTYRLQVLSSTGSRVFSERRDIGATPVTIDLKMLRLTGELLLGEEKLSNATVELTTGRGDSATFSTDQDGRFTGEVRKPSWKVLTAQIRAPLRQISRRMILKEFSASDSELDIRIVVPDEKVRGRIVDSTGVPRPDVPVRLTGGDSQEEHSGRSNAMGEFEFRGIGLGSFVASAGRQDTAPSKEVQVVVRKDRVDPSFVVLTLPPSTTLRVQLQSESGRPVAGTTLWVWPAGHAMPAGGSGLSVPPAGVVNLQFPASARMGMAQAYSKTHASVAACFEVPTDGETVFLTLPDLGGRIRQFIRSGDEAQPGTHGSSVLLHRGGGFLDWGQLLSLGVPWHPVDSGSESVSGAMAAGQYAQVFSDLSPGALASQVCAAQARNVTWQSVLPGQTTTLEIKPARNP